MAVYIASENKSTCDEVRVGCTEDIAATSELLCCAWVDVFSTPHPYEALAAFQGLFAAHSTGLHTYDGRHRKEYAHAIAYLVRLEEVVDEEEDTYCDALRAAKSAMYSRIVQSLGAQKVALCRPSIDPVVKERLASRVSQVIEPACFVVENEEHDIEPFTVLHSIDALLATVGPEYRSVQDPSGKRIVEEWLVDPNRKIYKRMVFAPPPKEAPNNCYNTWRGVHASKGSPEALPDSLRCYLGVGDGKLESWLAEMVANPGVPPSSAVALVGDGWAPFLAVLRAMVGDKMTVDATDCVQNEPTALLTFYSAPIPYDVACVDSLLSAGSTELSRRVFVVDERCALLVDAVDSSRHVHKFKAPFTSFDKVELLFKQRDEVGRGLYHHLKHVAGARRPVKRARFWRMI